MFGNTERRTQHWKKMVDPPGEAREDAWQVIQVAKRMGMGHLFPWPDDNWHEPMFEEYRSFGLGHGKDLASYAELTRTRGMLWPVVNGKETPYRYTAGYDPYVKKASRSAFLQGRGLRREGGVLAAAVPSAGRSRPTRSIPFWLTTGPRARALAHRLDDAAHPAAAPGGAERLRRDEPRRRRPRGAQEGRPREGGEPPRQPRAHRRSRRTRPAAAGHACSCRSSTSRASSISSRSTRWTTSASSRTTRNAPSVWNASSGSCRHAGARCGRRVWPQRAGAGCGALDRGARERARLRRRAADDSARRRHRRLRHLPRRRRHGHRRRRHRAGVAARR